MAKRMLIDATHAEETRVVVIDGNRLEEIDIESAAKKQLKGNIYLAKVTRVEPSLQAAFVEYGGNRHGFLALSEIHPDYYQIPVADREALIAEQEAEHADDDGDAEPAPKPRRRRRSKAAAATEETVGAEAEPQDGAADESEKSDDDGGNSSDRDTDTPADLEAADDLGEADGDTDDEDDAEEEATVEELGGDDAEPSPDAARVRQMRSRRYKIQEVIKGRQVMLVQVVKEERGNKGAALTTYLSLAGRYCVLMPNSSRGGGVSRKIANTKDRRRLRDIIKSLEIPAGMATIIRTAGAERTKPELKRDNEYLVKLWEQIRELTLRSSAPALVYEEANIIKRAIRDLYSRDIAEVLAEGEDAYRHAKDFMKALMPSHAKKVQPYKSDTIPLFHRFQVEQQLETMLSNVVQLPAGGYVVINQTEALVAIDVNSGRATRERNIEETALRTNLEAAAEIARQLRLRDLAGLVVIDFIDMDYHRNNHAVERKLKEALKTDRARIQVGRISPFGLLEMSRQRLRPSLLEGSFEVCPTCAGQGIVMSDEAAAVHALRKIEEEGLKRGGGELELHAPATVALYILNQKRQNLVEIEARYGLRVAILRDDNMVAPEIGLDRISTGAAPPTHEVAVSNDVTLFEDLDDDAASDDAASDETASEAGGQDGDEEAGGKRRRRRRRRKRSGEGDDEKRTAAGDNAGANDSSTSSKAGNTGSDSDDVKEASSDAEGEEKPRRRRSRRGGRGRGRGRSRRNGNDEAQKDETQKTAADSNANGDASTKDTKAETPAAPEAEGNGASNVAEAPAPAAAETVAAAAKAEKPSRKGWWNRLLD
jgi:ribonuclease E